MSVIRTTCTVNRMGRQHQNSEATMEYVKMIENVKTCGGKSCDYTVCDAHAIETGRRRLRSKKQVDLVGS